MCVSNAVPLTVIASASKVPSISASPDISNDVASISPEVLNITLSPPSTLNIIWLSVAKSISLSESLPITKLALTTDVIPVCAASTANVLFDAIVPPPDKPVPAVSVTDVWSICSLATKLVNASWLPLIVIWLPLPAVEIPAPSPAISNVSLSKSIDNAPPLSPWKSRSDAVSWLSTYALIDCCVARWVAESEDMLSSSLIAVPETPVFNTGDVNVLFVSVWEPVNVAYALVTILVLLRP